MTLAGRVFCDKVAGGECIFEIHSSRPRNRIGPAMT